MNPALYVQMLSTFLNNGYRFVKFNDFDEDLNSQVILRHDVDFCVERTKTMAKLEQDLGVYSTYYFLLTSDSYNLLSAKNTKYVLDIAEMGHSVGLHFDPTLYEDEEDGFKAEYNIFRDAFGDSLTMSFHRPSERILDGVDWLPKHMIGAYQKKFFKNITYISDSGGEFRFGHPLNHESVLLNKNIQLLIHPIWWMTEKADTINKIREFIEDNTESMSNHISNNCKPWKKYVDSN